MRVRFGVRFGVRVRTWARVRVRARLLTCAMASCALLSRAR